MAKRRRLLAILLSLALVAVLALAACGGDDDDEDEAEPTAAPVVTEEAAEPVVTVAPAEPTEEMMEPAATEEMMEPAATEEMMAPAATEEMAMEPAATEESMEVAMAPAATEEMMEPAATEEMAMEPAATEEAGLPGAEGEPLRIMLVVNGTLGDKSFFDSAQRGMDRLLDDGYNVEINTIELGADPANWETGLDDAMANSDQYDMLIVGTYQMGEYLGARAHQYPDKYFIMYDAPVPYADDTICVEGCTNVYSVTYAQNEGSFLAGVYAGAMTTGDLDGMNPDAVVGAAGGQDIPVINDFVVGYEQGACLVNPDTSFLVQYVGDWFDPATGKEIALAMYEQGADIVFQIAGGSGAGVFEAAQEQNKYAIGVDSDQATILMETSPEQAARILTSMMKNVDNSLYRAVDLHLRGELVYGAEEILGIAEGGVGLAYNDIYEESTPENVKELVTAAEEAVTNGEVEVLSVFGDSPAAVAADCTEMPETTFDVSPYLE